MTITSIGYGDFTPQRMEEYMVIPPRVLAVHFYIVRIQDLEAQIWNLRIRIHLIDRCVSERRSSDCIFLHEPFILSLTVSTLSRRDQERELMHL